MSLEENIFSIRTAEHLENEPPAYYHSSFEEAEWNVSSVTPSDQTWNDCPPAYDSLTDIPIWSIPGSALTVPPNDQLWDFPLPTPEYSEAPSNPYQISANTTIASNSFFKKKFQQGKPLTVGVLVILCAFVQVAVGTMLVFDNSYSETLLYGIPYWTSVCYIITGSLLISAKAKTTRGRVKVSLVFDILSMIFSSVGLTFNVLDIIAFCNRTGSSTCYSKGFTALNTLDINYILISANVIILCLCLSATVIGSYVLCLPRESPPSQVIENYYIPRSFAPEFLQTPSQLPPPPYTAKEDEEDETPH